MQFAHPHILWLIPIILILLIARYIYTARNARPTLSVSTTAQYANAPMPWRARLRHLLFVLRLCAISCLIIILARPQLSDSWRTTDTEGTDIVIALDVSSSMLTQDLKPNRIEAAKKMAQKFINGRPNDNIGVIVFAGESLTGIPLTMDHSALINYINGIKPEMLEDGTAIGDGLATSISRLINGKAKSKSIILLTDGSNNTGVVTPSDAADVAKEKKIKVYPIAIGTRGRALAPAYIDALGQIRYEMQQVVIDEATLEAIAKNTNGKYFRATDNQSLSKIFSEIDRLEKTHMSIRQFSHTEDDITLWAWLLFAFLAIELTLRYTVFRTTP